MLLLDLLLLRQCRLQLSLLGFERLHELLILRLLLLQLALDDSLKSFNNFLGI